MSDLEKLTPIAPKTKQSESKLTRRSRRVPWPLLLVPVLLVVAYFIFENVPKYLPGVARLMTDSPDATSSEESSSSLSAQSSSETPQSLPFRDLELERAETSAVDLVRQIGQLQDEVTLDQLALTEKQSEFDAIIDKANAADGHFARREFDLALSKYEEALRELDTYVKQNEVRFESALQTGLQALLDRDITLAERELGIATAIKPMDSELATARERLQVLPQVNDLIREGRRAQLQGEFEQAESLLLQALALDPETQGLQGEILEAQRHQSDEYFSSVITKAYDALTIGDVDAATQNFEEAERLRPGDPAPRTGLRSIAQQQRTEEIAQLKVTAETLEVDGLIEEAKLIYEDLVRLNTNLAFAREGLARTAGFLQIKRAINRVLSDPDMLSSHAEFENAKITLEEARQQPVLTDDFSNQVFALEQLLSRVSEPLPIVIVSDNAMDIRLATVGELGPFERRELTLRPGRYVISGSGKGCRDVRKTFVVAKDMQPVSIRCNEPI